MRKLFLFAMITLLGIAIYAQVPLKTRSANITFNANKHNAADYVGTCTEGTGVFNPANGQVALLIPAKTIHFPNALLEEHVNENYLESGKYPNITFKGNLTNFNASMLEKNGTYTLSASGAINMHGVEVPYKSDKIMMEVKGKAVSFKVSVDVDYKAFKINIPSTVEEKIANPMVVKATIPFNL